MKNYFISIISAVCFSAAVIAQIPNAGFENWTTVGTYENPDGWSTLNNKTATQSMFTATKGTPGSPGNSYLKLTSKTVGASVVPGIAVSGKLDTMSMMPVSGVSYTMRPATFSGKWQHMIYGSSQGSIMVLLTKWNATQNMRDTIAHGMLGLAGMAMSWANFSFNLTYMDSLHYPDSCIIVLKASGSNPTNNDYLWVDNLAFAGSVAVYTPPIDTTGLTEISKNNLNISMFPNPSNGQITINFDLISTEKTSIQIVDITGKLVKEIAPANLVAGKNTVSIVTSGMSKGNYTVVIRSNNSTNSKKLVVE